MADEFDQYKVKSQGAAKPPTDEFDEFKAMKANPEGGKSLLTSVPKDVALGAAKGLATTLYAPRRILSNYFPSMAEGLPPAGALDPTNTAQSVGKGAEQFAEFLAPMGAVNRIGKVAKVAESLPVVGKVAAPLARIGANALTTGGIEAAHGGDFKTGVEAGALAGGAGEGLRLAAPALARSALRIRPSQILHGAEPGEAVLNETSGVRPATIERQSGEKIGNLSGALQTAASGSRAPVSVQPALDVVDDAIAKASRENSPLVNDLQEIRNQLTTSRVTGQPLAINTTAEDVLNRRRGIGDLRTNWERLGTGDQPTVERTYGKMTGALHDAVPETVPIDSRIQNLIPVQRNAKMIAASPGALERTAERFTRPTGALLGGVTGGTLGYREGGLPGAIGGFVGGVAAPEILFSPTGKMVMARGLNSGLPTDVVKSMILSVAGQKGQQ